MFGKPFRQIDIKVCFFRFCVSPCDWRKWTGPFICQENDTFNKKESDSNPKEDPDLIKNDRIKEVYHDYIEENPHNCMDRLDYN